jgi:tRNA threonylcarbamoyladenosine biosynthesis protein TsaE
MPEKFTSTAQSTEDMNALAEEFLSRFPDGGHFALFGEMGVGKTTFIQGICKALGLHFAGSPTFSLVNEYELNDGRRLFHFDLYRLNSAEELSAIGFEEYLDSGAYIFVEWPQLGGSLTEDFHRIELSDDHGTRTLKY